MAETDRPPIAVLGFDPATEPAGEASLQGIDEFGDVRLATDADELATALDGAPILLVLDFRAGVIRQAWPAARTLRWIHAASAGVENLMFRELRDSPVVVTNARGVFDDAIAEWVLGVMLAFCKGLHVSRDLQRDATWEHRESERLAGKRMLVVGAGGIGRAIARLGIAAGVDVTLAARSARTDEEFGTIAASEDLDRLVGTADFVTLAAPLTPETRAVLNADRLALMRPDARLINVGRGELVDESALRTALRDGQIGGAALDVFTTEPLPPDDELWAMPNVIVSPHMSGDVAGWRQDLIDQFTANLRRWVNDEPLENVIDKNAGYATGAHRP